MANEVTITCSLSVSKGGASIASGSLSKTLDMTGVDVQAQTQNIGTSYEAIAISADIGTNGFMVIKNLDATNYVTVSFDAGSTDHVKIPAGCLAMFKSIVDPQLKANTAAVDVQFWIHEE